MRSSYIDNSYELLALFMLLWGQAHIKKSRVGSFS